MSGIVGLVAGDGPPIDRERLRALTDFQAFRGPEGRGTWADDVAGLGQTEDRAGPHRGRAPQPAGLDGELRIAADARLDGRPELIASLRARGRDVPDGAGDAELILHAYRAWGDDCPGHLLGDFAFALWDRPRRRLLCAVDHFRVKLLYYARVGGGLVVANTLDCLRLHPEVSDRLDESAVADFLLFEHYQSPDLTIYADVRRLPPAHRLTWEAGRLRVSPYWSVPPPDDRACPPGDCLERFDELLARAVGDRLSGRRAGVLLSGGIDSPMVAAMACRLLDRDGGEAGLQAFTAVHDRTMPDRERHYATLAARALAIPQEIWTCDFDLAEWAEDPAPATPEPVNNPVWRWTLRCFERLASRASPVLTGVDGDTLLKASLPLHWRSLLRRGRPVRVARELAWYATTRHRLPPVGLRTALRTLRGKAPEPLPPPPAWLNPEFAARVDAPGRWAAYHRPRPPTSPRDPARADLATPIWASVFDVYDASWTGQPLEFVHPLMDVRLVAFLLGLPAVPWCADKELFRRWLRPLVPPEVHRRPKTPLVDCPVRLQILKGGAPFAEELAWSPAAGNYIDTGTIGSRPSATELHAVYHWLRPISLNTWLLGRQ